MNTAARALFALALAALATPVHAQCIGAGRDKPSLNKKILKDATFEQVSTEVRGGGAAPSFQLSAVERATLPGGIGLTVALRNCNTYANVYEFSLPRDTHAESDTPFWLRRAADLLDRVRPANLDTLIPLEKLAGLLRERAVDPAAAGFEDGSLAATIPNSLRGEGHEGYEVGYIKETDETVTLSVMYYFNL